MKTGLLDRRYRNLIEYLLSSDEFLIFKRRIVKVHLEIKSLTLEQMGPGGQDEFIRLDREQIFQQELKLAIEMSLKIQQEIEKEQGDQGGKGVESVVESLKTEREELIKKEQIIFERVREGLAERTARESGSTEQQDQL